MEERINRILKHYNLSSTQFADEIGVQRSSVSHVLTGRNKPGFDFIQKIIGTFPEISAEWLITGVGNMFKQDIQPSDELFVEQKSEQESYDTKRIERSEEDIKTNSDNDLAKETEIDVPKRSVERIIVIYSDRSFEEYHPR